MSRAREIMDAAPLDTTWSEGFARAQAIVRETGDLPHGIYYELLMRYGFEHADTLLALRPHDAPAYPRGRV